MLNLEQIHEQHKYAEETARIRFREVLGENPQFQTTVGKHEAHNHIRLKEVLSEARELCPRAADIIAWFLWWDVLEAQRLAFLSAPDNDKEGPAER